MFLPTIVDGSFLILILTLFLPVVNDHPKLVVIQR